MQGPLLLLALVVCVAHTIHVRADVAVYPDIGEVGFDTFQPPNYDEARPYVTTNYDTTAVSTQKPFEAVLRCFDQSPVYRAVNCDLLTWDSCNNIYGGSDIATQWTVTVEALQKDRNDATTPEMSRLVSPLYHLRTGVTRFYFTPVVIGPYRVTITRKPNVQPTVMYTKTTLSQIVIVHDVVAACTHRYFGEMIRQYQDTLWAEGEWLNERQRYPGVRNYSIPNTILPDRYDIYPPKAAELQNDVRRRPIEQYVKLDRVERLPPEDNRQHYCDMIPRVN